MSTTSLVSSEAVWERLMLELFFHQRVSHILGQFSCKLLRTLVKEFIQSILVQLEIPPSLYTPQMSHAALMALEPSLIVKRSSQINYDRLSAIRLIFTSERDTKQDKLIETHTLLNEGASLGEDTNVHD
ncbi:hypothetical protein T11_344 [Trichinella zimbabwensis]|uniref:Uncharacterized protein n=1 Tax=Trichinella zimbabwensis TaxID=268475 RepID=A0A0V1H0Q5_9BILA|nr:hypothetical protein T11_344 [Trichinella zimbabwensis]